ncbi:hypothetical protein AALO_G00260530 [Alosa alosa]|uniref:Interleukin-6 n=1 Tax=Alosa alosa TaxID=278164 RepID=A0AAV6FUT6_9TELE|nr:hypothetical protein AALO_G00260530 [Alosa alosa]
MGGLGNSSILSLILLLTFFIAGSLICALLAATLSLTEGKSIAYVVESGDVSGDEFEAKTDNPVVKTASLLQEEVAILKAEFNSNFSDVDDTYDIKSPINSISDGCFPGNFNKSRCLKRIATGILQYVKQMQYVKEEFQSTLVDGIIHRTSTLQNLVKDLQKPKDRADDDKISEDILPKDSQWERKTVTKAILRSFDQFLIDAHRALRHITRTRKFGERRHQLPHELTPLN